MASDEQTTRRDPPWSCGDCSGTAVECRCTHDGTRPQSTEASIIATKFFRGRSAPYRYAARELAGLAYDALVDVVRSHNPEMPPVAMAASYLACAAVGEALGATRMELGYDARAFPLEGANRLIDHAMTFYVGRRAIGLLARPYLGAKPHPEAEKFAARLAVWTTGTDRCSWYPGMTQTYVLTLPAMPALNALGFYRISA